jgi:hypothetical protein
MGAKVGILTVIKKEKNLFLWVKSGERSAKRNPGYFRGLVDDRGVLSRDTQRIIKHF